MKVATHVKRVAVVGGLTLASAVLTLIAYGLLSRVVPIAVAGSVGVLVGVEFGRTMLGHFAPGGNRGARKRGTAVHSSNRAVATDEKSQRFSRDSR